MRLMDEAMDIFSRTDSCSERSSKVARAVMFDINCDEEIYLKLKQQNLLSRL